LIKVLRAKIHRATITEAQADYIGSITIDRDLMDAVGIIAGESVLVADLDNAARFETYVMEGPHGSGTICVNGAAAHLVNVGDLVIIMAFGYVEASQAEAISPRVALLDENNKVQRMLS